MRIGLIELTYWPLVPQGSWPAQTAAIYDACREGRDEDARAQLAEIYPVLQFLLSGGYYAAMGADEVLAPARWPPTPTR